MNRRVLRGLRAALVDVLSTAEAGRVGTSDEEQLAFAVSCGRTILTTNRRDFARLHHAWSTAGQHHTGIIIVTNQRVAPGTVVAKVLAFHGDLNAAQMRNALIFIQNR